MRLFATHSWCRLSSFQRASLWLVALPAEVTVKEAGDWSPGFSLGQHAPSHTSSSWKCLGVTFFTFVLLMATSSCFQKVLMLM